MCVVGHNAERQQGFLRSCLACFTLCMFLELDTFVNNCEGYFVSGAVCILLGKV